MQLSAQQIIDFRAHVWEFYQRSARAMPWRAQPTPYFVFVSELMLQQTQVSRVLPKFETFVQALPSFAHVAAAPLGEILRLWSGLGYNRRAKFLHQSAKLITEKFHGQLPNTVEALTQLPGVGKNTAGAIVAYAFGQPALFVETNIRTVYFYHFLPSEKHIDDWQVLELLAQTLERERPREWYWALMDYGAHLKATTGNNIRRSRHYVKQSAFAGSFRQLRGAVLRELGKGPALFSELQGQLPDERLAAATAALQAEGLIEQTGALLRLTGTTKLP